MTNNHPEQEPLCIHTKTSAFQARLVPVKTAILPLGEPMKLPVPAWDIPCTLSSHGVVADDGCVWLCENPVPGEGHFHSQALSHGNSPLREPCRHNNLDVVEVGDDTTSCGSSEDSGTESTGKFDLAFDDLQSRHGQMVCVTL